MVNKGKMEEYFTSASLQYRYWTEKLTHASQNHIDQYGPGNLLSIYLRKKPCRDCWESVWWLEQLSVNQSVMLQPGAIFYARMKWKKLEWANSKRKAGLPFLGFCQWPHGFNTYSSTQWRLYATAHFRKRILQSFISSIPIPRPSSWKDYTIVCITYQQILSRLQQYSSQQRFLSILLALSPELCSSLKCALSSYTHNLQAPAWRNVDLNTWSILSHLDSFFCSNMHMFCIIMYKLALVFMGKIHPVHLKGHICRHTNKKNQSINQSMSWEKKNLLKISYFCISK